VGRRIKDHFLLRGRVFYAEKRENLEDEMSTGGIPLFAFSIVVVLAFAVIVGLLVLVYLKAGKGSTNDTTKKPNKDQALIKDAEDEDEDTVRRPPRRGIKKRAGGGRMKRQPVIREEEESSGDERVEAEIMFNDLKKEEETAARAPTKKVGAKKQRKLDAKEAKKQEREVGQVCLI